MQSLWQSDSRLSSPMMHTIPPPHVLSSAEYDISSLRFEALRPAALRIRPPDATVLRSASTRPTLPCAEDGEAKCGTVDRLASALQHISSLAHTGSRAPARSVSRRHLVSLSDPVCCVPPSCSSLTPLPRLRRPLPPSRETLGRQQCPV